MVMLAKLFETRYWPDSSVTADPVAVGVAVRSARVIEEARGMMGKKQTRADQTKS